MTGFKAFSIAIIALNCGAIIGAAIIAALAVTAGTVGWPWAISIIIHSTLIGVQSWLGWK
jgi:hypothetical protein